LYLKLGSPSSLAVAKPMPVAADSREQASPHGMSFDQIRASADTLASSMAADPENGAGWAMLARSYNVLGRYQEAAAAYEKAVSRLPPDAQLMADYADALAMSRGEKLEGKPLEIIRLALKTDPSNLKALALAGTEAYDRKAFGEAVKYWEKVVQIAPADSEFARSVGASLEEARARSAGRPPIAALPEIMPRRAGNPLPSASAGISGSVNLSPDLASRVKADDTVFIFARAENGPRMPLAILSRKAGEWPLRFVLDDTNAMSPNMQLSGASAVKVFARISRSGNATAQSGDLEGASGPVKPGSQGLQINIDRVLP
jgi:cytochrome c-type biogenesis protein CcmH